ncbi:MAG: PD40 domain-containing protein, partial [Verrucomicrobia bacterium]|nr:PD40 domain-containing protein [Verrucomicrobiota bacterium]
EINGVQYSPDGKWLATAHQDGRILVRSAEGVRAVAFAVQLHSPGTGGSRRVSWAPNGRLLASCGEDGRVNYVEFPGGKRRFELIQSEKPVWAVGWSPDGKWLAAGGEEGRLWIWLAESLPCSTVKRPVHIIERHYQRSGPSPTASPIQQHFFSWPFDWLHR